MIVTDRSIIYLKDGSFPYWNHYPILPISLYFKISSRADTCFKILRGKMNGKKIKNNEGVQSRRHDFHFQVVRTPKRAYL